MKIKLTGIAIALLFVHLFFGCTGSREGFRPKSLFRQFSLVENPNSLLKVGQIFTKVKGVPKDIRIDINLPLVSGRIEVAEYFIRRNMSSKFLASLLGIADFDLFLGDSLYGQISIKNASLFKSQFPISNFFDSYKRAIIEELNLFDYDTSSVWIITQLVKSKDVNIRFGSATGTGINASDIVGKKVSNASGKIDFSVIDSSTLSFKSNDSLAILYTLEKLKLKTISFKDPTIKDSIIDIQLTGIVQKIN